MRFSKIKGKGLMKNASLNVIKQLSTLAFSLITFPYVSRVLGDRSYGQYSFSYSIIEYLLIFSASAGGAYAIREGARIKDDGEKIDKFSSEIFSIGCVFTLIAYIVLFLLIFFWKKAYCYKYLLLIISIRLVATTIGVEWVFNIFEDFRNITIRQIVTQIVGLLLTLLLVHSKNDVNLYAVATVIAMGGANLINFFVSKKYTKIKFTKSMELKKHIKPIFLILFYSSMITVYSNADILMLGVMKNDSVVGTYSVAAKIYGIIKSIFISALTVLLPRLASYLGKNEVDKMKNIVNKTLSILLVVLFPTMILLVHNAKTIILIVAGKDYVLGSIPLKLLSFALLFAVVSALLTTNIMIPNRQENKITLIVSLSATINIVLNYFFIPSFGASAAALTTVIAEMTVCVGALLYSKDYIYVKKTVVNIIKLIFASVNMVLILIFTSNVFSNIIENLVLGSIFSSIVYLFSLLILNYSDIKNIFSQFYL